MRLCRRWAARFSSLVSRASSRATSSLCLASCLLAIASTRALRAASAPATLPAELPTSEEHTSESPRVTTSDSSFAAVPLLAATPLVLLSSSMVAFEGPVKTEGTIGSTCGSTATIDGAVGGPMAPIEARVSSRGDSTLAALAVPNIITCASSITDMLAPFRELRIGWSPSIAVSELRLLSLATLFSCWVKLLPVKLPPAPNAPNLSSPSLTKALCSTEIF
mmetsp:Transcript_58480/g.116114  ORF Transcript_58480/g.116114 Transcript_58480/m.116114 type:complete len:221 (+) Transcript_58480:471-1133(+)